MSKRAFRRSEPGEVPARYPTLDEFDSGRRRFLGQLGAVLLGAGGLAAGLTACGNRPVGLTPDASQLQGDKAGPDARVDQEVVREPDYQLSGGGTAQPDAGADRGPGGPEAGQLEGDVAGPDARVDEADAELNPTPGYAPVMDARIDRDGTSPKP